MRGLRRSPHLEEPSVTAKILIVDSAPAAARAALVKHGGASYSDNYAAALRSQMHGLVDGIDFVVLAAGDCAAMPQGVALTDFDGSVWTGSPLHAYDVGPIVQHQVGIARAAFDSGTPGFGSCWGMQVMTVALGGQVRLHPVGGEFGVARQVRVNEAGRRHALLQGKRAVFDALCWHQDEVCVPPPGAVVLAANDHSAVQAMVCEDGTRSFWGVQYHPEFDLAHMAAILNRSAERLVADGFAPEVGSIAAMAADYRALQRMPGRKDISWHYGLGSDLTDPAQHRLELSNWLRTKVAPRAASR